MKNTKGITLIALIITIIVMLILVAVSVNILIKSNLIGNAKKATNKYSEVAEEEDGGTVEIEDKKYNSVDDYLKDKGMINEVHAWKRNGDDLTCEYCTAKLTIGQEIDYKDNGTGTSSITAEKAGGYVSGTAKSNQPTTTQTINRDGDTKWVVLGMEDTNKNGTNETLLITTKTPTTGKIVLYGAAAYNNAVEEINRMCKELYGEVARGMTIEDVNNCLQYIPEGGMYLNMSDNIQTTNNFTTKLSDLPIWNAIKDNHKTPDGADTEENFGKVVLNGYWYSGSTNETSTDIEKNIIFGNSNNNRYWLASCGVYAVACRYYANFGPGAVYGGDVNAFNRLFSSNNYEGSKEFSLRAVVTLKTDIPKATE